MKKTIFCITILLVCLSGSVTFGIAPIGQPSTNLRTGWWSGGIDYSQTELDLITKDFSFFSGGSPKDENIDLLLGKAGYGIKDNWEVFVGFGMVKTEDFSFTITSEWGDSGNVQTDNFEFDPDLGYAAQIGTKITLYEKALIKAGVACQFTWLGLSGILRDDTYKDGQYMYSDKVDIDSDMMILQIAPGISYEFLFGFSVYGGPLYQWVDSKAETSEKYGAFKGKTEIEDSSFGGWVGLHADIDILTSLNLEYQMTGSSSTIGLSLSSKF